MRVAVVGGGIYGCHISATLRSLGIDVTLFEASDALLTGASGNNQFRLHQGFHYPRSFSTRTQSRDGYHRFKERYPNFSRPMAHNLYGVAARDSWIDYRTYRGIMSTSGLDFRELDARSEGIEGVEGLISTDEEVLMVDDMRAYFATLLGQIAVMGVKADPQDLGRQGFDWSVDCTWGQEDPLPGYFFEPTLLLYYQANDSVERDWSLTIVDGPFCSLYQTQDPGVFTLSSVTYTPLGNFGDPGEAQQRRQSIDVNEIEARREMFEGEMRRFFPGFSDQYSYVGPQLSVKTKPVGRADHRSCDVSRQGRVIRVLSGKVDNVFYAATRVVEFIEQGNNESR